MITVKEIKKAKKIKLKNSVFQFISKVDTDLRPQKNLTWPTFFDGMHGGDVKLSLEL